MAEGRGVPSQPTLEEVAAVAGVSRATASRVINGSPRVSGPAKAAVDLAVAQLGYVPNRAARQLVTRRTDSVALIVSEPETRVFSEPFFSGVVRGISDTLAETEMHLVLLMAQKEAQRARLERYVQNRHVDGVILLSLHGDDPLPLSLSRIGMPVVMLGRPFVSAEGITWLDADNLGGARLAVDHLLASGRRTIATITGPLDMCAGVDRLGGYRTELEAHGIPYDEELVVVGDFTEAAGHALTEQLLARRPQLDAIFAASDLMATGALAALRSAGRRVPEDVAVIGFDDSPSAQFTDPPLTSVRQPVEEMARLTTDLLLAQISTGDSTPHNVVVGTELILRASG
ncbi:LacI family DNA-binding transcriptional regulator [Acidothermaceae bacterium B102]|nr:LacI family DNA-binding transcriptional regulator [Acidothermaceae bacterium B102]